MDFHQRTLPHYYPREAVLFLTWRLFDAPCPRRVLLPQAIRDDGRTFVQYDRLLDKAASGATWLKKPHVARIVANAIDQGEIEYRLYERFAWVIMPNHVHLVIRPFRELSVIMRWIKGSTARSANLMLGRTGKPFWQYESYDHCVRNTAELNRVIRYVERNPVAAGLASAIEDWPWSSAGRRPTPQSVAEE